MSEFVLVVNVELYLTVVVRTNCKISGSTITGVIDATLYFLRLVTIAFLVVSVMDDPDLGLIET